MHTNQDISTAEYPFEMYCAKCDRIFSYLNYEPVSGAPIMAKGHILLNGTYPKPGDKIPPCCGYRKFMCRKRKNKNI